LLPPFVHLASALATTSDSIKPSHVAMGYHAGAGSLFARACGGNPFISHQALAKIIGSQNSIGTARSPCLAGKWSKWDRWTASGTARPSAVAPLKRPAALSIDPVFGIPTPNINVNGLLSAWFPTFVKRVAVCLESNRPPAKRNTAPHCAARRGIRFNGRRNEKAPPHRNGGALIVVLSESSLSRLVPPCVPLSS